MKCNQKIIRGKRYLKKVKNEHTFIVNSLSVFKINVLKKIKKNRDLRKATKK